MISATGRERAGFLDQAFDRVANALLVRAEAHDADPDQVAPVDRGAREEDLLARVDPLEDLGRKRVRVAPGRLAGQRDDRQLRLVEDLEQRFLAQALVGPARERELLG